MPQFIDLRELLPLLKYDAGLTLSPMDFGAAGTGGVDTDDGDALNALFSMIRGKLAVEPYMAIEINGGGKIYRTTKSINMTGMQAWNLRVSNLYIIGACTGKAVFDLIGTRGYTFDGVGVWGDKTHRPSAGFQAQRGTPGGFCDNVSFKNCFTDGYFTRASYHAYGQETAQFDHCTFYNRDNTGRVLILEGYNANPMTSDYSPVMTGATSFINDQFLNIDCRYLPAEENIANITAITHGSSMVVTCPGHSFQIGDEVVFQYVENLLVLSTKIPTVTSRTTNTITVNLDSTGYPTFGGSGVVIRRATKSPLYLARTEGFGFHDCYVVSYGQAPVEIAFPDPGFQRVERITFDNALFEGGGQYSLFKFNTTAPAKVLGFSLSVYNSHAFATIIENTSPNVVDIFALNLEAFDPLFETPLAISPDRFSTYGARIVYNSWGQISPDDWVAFDGEITSISTGKTMILKDQLRLDGGNFTMDGNIAVGGSTPTLGNNKPGATGGPPTTWTSVRLSDGNVYWMPLWLS